MIRFLIYWAGYFIFFMAVGVVLVKTTDIDMSIAFENAPVISGIMALAITRKYDD